MENRNKLVRSVRKIFITAVSRRIRLCFMIVQSFNLKCFKVVKSTIAFVVTLFTDLKAMLGQNLKKVQVVNDQEKAQSERDSLSKNRDGKKLN